MAWEDGRTRTWTFNHKEVPVASQRTMIEEIQTEIDNVDWIVGHNLKFDLQWLRSIGVNYSRVKLYCTQVAEYVISGQKKQPYHLANVSKRYAIADKIDRVKKFWDAGWATDEIPLNILDPYLRQDCINALVVFQRQVPRILRWQLEKIIALQMEVMGLLSEMEYHGARIDVDAAEGYYATLRDKLQQIESELKIQLNRDDLNLRSGDELSAALYGGKIFRDAQEAVITTRKATIREPYLFQYKDPRKQPIVKWKNREVKELVAKTRKTQKELELPRIFKPVQGTELDKGGYYSTSKNVLAQLKGTNKTQKMILALLEAHSKTAKAVSTFRGDKEGTGLLGKVQPDGYVHPSFNQTVTATGRLSSSNPNGQNLSSRDKEANPAKKVFVPRFDLIGNADLSQLEWRVAAFMSQDPTAIQEILDDIDYHRDNAIKFFGADPKLENGHKKFKPLRTTAKIFGFRLLYGGTEFGMFADKSMPNYSLKKWAKIVESYYEKYDRLKEWQDENIVLVHKNEGWMRTPSGRILTFPRFDNPDRNGDMYSGTAIKNYPVQSFSSDITTLAMVVVRKRMQAAGCKSVFFLQVHDSLVFDLVREETDCIADICMETFNELPQLIKQFWGVEFNVPLTGEFEVGDCYGQMKTIRE